MTKETMDHLSIIDQIVPIITGMWAVVNGPGSSNRLHSHPYNNMSGVFYLQVPEDSGALVFHDPRPQSEVLAPPKKPGESIFIPLLGFLGNLSKMIYCFSPHGLLMK